MEFKSQIRTEAAEEPRRGEDLASQLDLYGYVALWNAGLDPPREVGSTPTVSTRTLVTTPRRLATSENARVCPLSIRNGMTYVVQCDVRCARPWKSNGEMATTLGRFHARMTAKMWRSIDRPKEVSFDCFGIGTKENATGAQVSVRSHQVGCRKDLVSQLDLYAVSIVWRVREATNLRLRGFKSYTACHPYEIVLANYEVAGVDQYDYLPVSTRQMEIFVSRDLDLQVEGFNSDEKRLDFLNIVRQYTNAPFPIRKWDAKRSGWQPAVSLDDISYGKNDSNIVCKIGATKPLQVIYAGNCRYKETIHGKKKLQ